MTRALSLAAVAILTGICMSPDVHGHVHAAGLVASAAERTGAKGSQVAQVKNLVRTYWRDVSHRDFVSAYQMLSPGIQGALSEKQFAATLGTLLHSTGSVKASVGKVKVSGPMATARVTLHASEKGAHAYSGYQHLYLVGHDWRISDAGGGLTPRP